jgi:hypothetical protein
MDVLSTTAKGKLGLTTAGVALKNPRATRLVGKAARPAARTGLQIGKGLATRQARKRAERIGRTAREVGETLAVVLPEAAQLLGWVEPPPRRRIGPYVAVGIVVGALGMYVLEPGDPGKARREKVRSLIS